MSKQQGILALSQLRGTVAVVTGAGNNGIGWGICQHAAIELGMHVVAIDLHESLVTDAQQRLRALDAGVTCLGIQADVTQPDQLAACLAEIQAQLPGVRIGAVFANAGVIFNRTILKSPPEHWATTFNVNVLGVVNTIQAFVPALMDSAEPSIFCATASIGGLVRGDGGAASYQASKHAVVSLTESLSFELANKAPQVRVHVLCPCIVESALGVTSQRNFDVSNNNTPADAILPQQPQGIEFAMTTERHAQQVFDHLAMGNFYMVTDNLRPYVDHDFPFDGLKIAQERFDGIADLTLDNADAMNPGPSGQPSAILKGPMFQEMMRRRRANH